LHACDVDDIDLLFISSDREFGAERNEDGNLSYLSVDSFLIIKNLLETPGFSIISGFGIRNN